jgi:hypothetical protein
MPVPDFSPGEVLTAAAMDSIGLWLVKTQTIGTGVSSVVVADAFSSIYDNYKVVVFGGVGSTVQVIQFQLTGSATGYYGNAILSSYSGSTVSGNPITNAASWTFGGVSTPNTNAMNIDLLGPNLPKTTTFQTNYLNTDTAGVTGSVSGFHNGITQFTGFTLIVGGTMSGGTIRVYGYRN